MRGQRVTSEMPVLRQPRACATGDAEGTVESFKKRKKSE